MSGPDGIRPQDRLSWHRQLTRDPELSSVDIHLGLVISGHFSNGDASCYPAMETLAREARMHRATAVRAVKKLGERGHLIITPGIGRGMANTYTMVIREPYPPTEKGSASATLYNQKGSASATLSDPKVSLSDPLKCRPGATPTLKEDNSKKERGSEVFSVGKEDNPKPTPSTNGCRRGDNGRYVLRVNWPQWQAWLKFHQANGDPRAGLMKRSAESSRWGEWCWEEGSEWPPTPVTVLGKQAVGR